MARWYYKGNVTHAIDLPGGESRVLSPRRPEFDAPESAVRHLVSVGLVKRLPDAPQPKKDPVPEVAQPSPAPSFQKPTSPQDDSGSATGPETVVESLATVEEGVPTPSEEDGEPVQEKKKKTRTRRSDPSSD